MASTRKRVIQKVMNDIEEGLRAASMDTAEDDELLKAKKLAKSLREQTDNFLMTGNRKDDSWKKDGFKFADQTI